MSRPLYIGLAVLVAIGVLSVIGFLADPFGWRENKITDLENKNEVLSDEAMARSLQGVGEAAQPQRVNITVTMPVAAAQTALEPIFDEARTAPDANQPIAPDRLARLRAADRSLCEQSPGLDGCPAPATGPARSR